MSLNAELLAHIQAAEDEYGHVSNWPDSVLKKARKLADRYGNEAGFKLEELADVRNLAERGFFVTHIGIKLHHSRDWVLNRVPEDFEFIATEEDQRLLKTYQDKSVREVGRLLHRDLSWVREMRRKYGWTQEQLIQEDEEEPE